MREALLAELEASRQVVAELDEHELMRIQGGGQRAFEFGQQLRRAARERQNQAATGEGPVLRRTQSAPAIIQRYEHVNLGRNPVIPFGYDSPDEDFEQGQGVDKIHDVETMRKRWPGRFPAEDGW